MRSVIVGTAGHIDHGKTALVKALTGVDTDRLPEEKARGITIDLGFAHVNWEGFDVSFIDVPGHEKFVKNMLAGIGGIDLLVLVVAADESIMPQTREHFDICRLLSISSGVVAITKMDLVDAATLERVRCDIQDLVQGSFLEGAPVFAVSAKTGEGMEAIQNGILKAVNSIPQRESNGIFRLPVDRVFTLKGRGTVITGTLMSGRIPKDSQAEILPSHRKTKIRSVHAHNQNVPEAFAGQRTALNLQGIEKEDIHRGDVLSEPGFLESTSLVDARISLLSNSTRPLLHNSLVRFHHLTTDVLARVTVLGTGPIRAGESGFVQLRLQRPLIAVHGDRFILRGQSPLITIGGGLVLDAMPIKRVAKGDRTALERLNRLEHASVGERFAIAVAEKGMAGANEDWLKSKLALPVLDILKLQTDEIIHLNDQPLIVISKVHEGLLLQKIVDAVTAFHQSNPLLPGIPKEELWSKSFSFIPMVTFLAILERGVSLKKIQLFKGIVAIFDRKVSLNSQEEELALRTENFLLQAGLEFPGFDRIAGELQQRPENAKNLIYLLVRQGKIIKIAEDYFLHSNTWEALKQRIRGFKSTKKTFTVPDFKTVFGISRKYAIPLLEQLDREGVTRRSGNERIIL